MYKRQGEIRIFSRDEKKQDDMRHEYQAKYPEASNKIKFYIGDVRDIQSVSYTHLPFLENNPKGDGGEKTPPGTVRYRYGIPFGIIFFESHWVCF